MSDNFKYYECQNGNLCQGEILNYICFDQHCTKNGLICCVCKTNEHKDHKTLPQKYLL